MTPISELLKQFEIPRVPFPGYAVQEAIERRAEITPELLRILEDTIDRAEELAEDREYIAHFYALLLLAQFRETRAYPLVVRFASLPTAVLDSLSDDFTNDPLPRILASVSGGEIIGIQSLIEDESADQWARSAAIEALIILDAIGAKNRDEIVEYFTMLFRGRLQRRPSYVWDALVSCTCKLHPAELMDDISEAYAEGLADPTVANLDKAKSDLAAGKQVMLDRLAANPAFRLIDDTLAEMEDWECFQEESAKQVRSFERARQLAEYMQELGRPQPPTSFTPVVQRYAPKIGRNEPCPCGSGKKYKKCCGG